MTGIILGLYGNRFYKKHAEKKVQTIKQTTGDMPEKEQVLKNKGGRRWYGPIFALLIFLLIYMVPAILILDQQIAQEDPIETVKYTEFYDYPGVFVDELFNTMFEEGEWVLIEDKPEYHVIAFNGIDTDSLVEQEITIQFYNEAGSDESEVLFVEIDGVELDIYDSNNFLDDLFEAHETMH